MKNIINTAEQNSAINSIVAIAQYHGEKITDKQIKKTLLSNNTEPTGLGLMQLSEKLGFECRPVVAEKKEIPSSRTMPFIASDSRGKYLVVKKLMKKTILLKLLTQTENHLLKLNSSKIDGQDSFFY